MKSTVLYEEVNDMSAEVIFGLIFITIAVIGRVIVEAINSGVFDMLTVRLNNYILSRIERNERGDI